MIITRPGLPRSHAVVQLCSAAPLLDEGTQGGVLFNRVSNFVNSSLTPQLTPQPCVGRRALSSKCAEDPLI